MQQNTKNKKDSRKANKRADHLCITCTEVFKQEMEVVAFLKRFKNVSDFIKSLIANPTQPFYCPLLFLPKKEEFKKSVFPKQKGSSKEKKPQVRFYVSEAQRKRIDQLTKKAGYKYYVDFLLSQIVPVVEAHQKQIDAYLDYTETAQKQIISSKTKKPKNYDNQSIPIS